MQLLVEQIKNNKTISNTLCNKFTLVLLVLLSYITIVAAELSCHQCRGINCLRTSYEATQKCLNDLDICVNIFDGQTIMAQGCWEQLPEELRKKCITGAQRQNSNELSECFKCNENLCNDLSSDSFQCLQCDSERDESCLTNPLSLLPSNCGISRTPNMYCFAKQEGGRVIRNCSYTLEEQISCLNGDSCMICDPKQLRNCNNIKEIIDNSTSDGENTDDGRSEKDLIKTNKLTCHQCRGINCLRTSYNATQKCLNDMDICVTIFDGQTILAQGCWEQLSEEVRSNCNNDTQCFKCNENLCNNLGSRSFSCIQCDSDNDNNCLANPQSLVPLRCGVSRTPNEYCFVTQKDKSVIRGCFYNLEEQLSCLSSHDCMICQPSELSDCNNIKLVVGNSDGSGPEGNNTGSDGTGNEPEEGGPEDSDAGGGNTEHTGSGNETESEYSSSDDGESGWNTEDGGSDTGGEESGHETNGCSNSTLNTYVFINIILAFFATKFSKTF